jgi:hypothetical protein
MGIDFVQVSLPMESLVFEYYTRKPEFLAADKTFEAV